MSRWTHRICLECWITRNGDREPVRVLNEPPGRCCYCAVMTADGIYVRDNPDAVPGPGCGGEHDE
jgi:hypothetical protein